LRRVASALLIAGMLVLGTGSAFAQESLLMSTVKGLYGVPYKAAGTSKKGFDCSGFTRYVFQTFGVELPHSSAAQYKLGTKVSRDQLLPGDLVFFNTNGRSISHVGIYIGNNTFVHSASGQGVVKTKLTDPYYWNKRYVGAKRVTAPTVQAAVQAPPAKKPVQAASVPEPKPQKK